MALVICGFVFFGVFLGISTHNLSTKKYEFYIFLVIFAVFQLLWLFITNRRSLLWTENNENADANINGILFYSSLLFFLASYFLIAYFGAVSSFITVELFGVYKEFGLHIDALNRIINGNYPWLDFTYPYGFLPVYLSYLLWGIGIHNTNSILYIYLFLNIIAVLLFLFLLKKYSNKRIFLFSSASFLIYLLPSFLQSFNEGGFHNNWLRYLSSLILILLFPEGKFIKVKAFLSGMSLVGIFLIAPEMLIFVAFSLLLFLLFYLYNNAEIKSLLFIFCGIITALIVFLLILPHDNFVMIFKNIYQNVFYQAKIILNNGILSNKIPNLLTDIGLFLKSPSVGVLKDIYSDLIFYFPPVVLAWMSGIIYKNRREALYAIKLSLFWIAIFSAYLKAMGASSLGYALLCTPLIILALAFIYKNHKVANWKIFVLIFLFVFMPSLLQIQQRYLPCLISRGYACEYLKAKRNIDKTIIPLSSASNLQYFYKDEVDDFMKIINFLDIYGSGNFLVLSDMTSLYYFSKTINISKIMLPSLYYDKEDIKIFDNLKDENIVLVSPMDYNYVRFDARHKFPTIFSKLIKDYKMTGSCGPFDFYLKNSLIDGKASDYLICNKY